MKKKGKIFSVKVPTWRPDIFGEIDLVEEVIRIMGLDNIKSIEPEKTELDQHLIFIKNISI